MAERLQAVIPRYGSPEVFRIEKSPLPEPGPGDMLIQVYAAGINFADLLARRGLYPDAPRPPMVVGYEVAGKVLAVGAGVDPQWQGRRVIALTRFGGYATHVLVKQEQVFPLPETLSYAQGAAIPVNYLTAYQLLIVMGGLKAEETLLIHNAGGGVGLAALDLAGHVGCRTIGTASSHKHAFLRERGLQQAIDYRKEDWVARVMALTEGRGVDLVIDPLGGKNFARSYRVLAPAGRLGMFGISSATESRWQGKLSLLVQAIRMPVFHPAGLMNRNRGVFGVNLGHMWREAPRLRRWADVLLKGVEEGWVRPHVDRTFPLSQVAQAHQYLEARKNIGKVVLETSLNTE